MSFLTFLYGRGEANNGKTPEQLDAELKAFQAKRAAEKPEKFGGKYQEAFDQHLELQMSQDEDVEAQLASEFDEGLDEGAENIAGVFNVAGNVTTSVLRAVPWWLWLAVGAYLFLALGGLRLIKSRFGK